MREVVVQIPPFRIHPFDQRKLPRSVPALERLLPRDRVGDLAVILVPDQPRHAVATGEAVRRARAMLMDAPREVVGDADIERPVPRDGEDLGPVGRAPQTSLVASRKRQAQKVVFLLIFYG